jgi:hypothetical protein
VGTTAGESISLPATLCTPYLPHWPEVNAIERPALRCGVRSIASCYCDEGWYDVRDVLETAISGARHSLEWRMGGQGAAVDAKAGVQIVGWAESEMQRVSELWSQRCSG